MTRERSIDWPLALLLVAAVIAIGLAVYSLG